MLIPYRPYILFAGALLYALFFLNSDTAGQGKLTDMQLWIAPLACVAFWSDLFFVRVKRKTRAMAADVVTTFISVVIFFCFVIPILFAGILG